MVFAASYLPPAIQCYWNVVANFASHVASSTSTVSPEAAKLAMENVQLLYKDAFSSDAELTHQLITMEYSVTKKPLGIPLVPSQTKCSLCVGKPLLRGDRPSRLTLYRVNGYRSCNSFSQVLSQQSPRLPFRPVLWIF